MTCDWKQRAFSPGAREQVKLLCVCVWCVCVCGVCVCVYLLGLQLTIILIID